MGNEAKRWCPVVRNDSSDFLKKKSKTNLEYMSRQQLCHSFHQTKTEHLLWVILILFIIPGCNKLYIGNTESTVFNRTKEHCWYDNKSAILQYLDEFSSWKDIVDLYCSDRQLCIRSKTFSNQLSLSLWQSEQSPELKTCKDSTLF